MAGEREFLFISLMLVRFEGDMVGVDDEESEDVGTNLELIGSLLRELTE